jgi:uncharacterized protein with NRDE domain
MKSMEKVWKQDMRYYIREAFNSSLDEDDNYNIVINGFDNEFIDPSNLTKEDVKELGGSSKLAKQLVDDYDDLSNEEQNEVWYKVEELIKDYGQLLMDEEEDWIRSKISKLLKTA